VAARLHDIERLRMRFAGKDDFLALVAVMAQRHADGLGNRRRLVQQRGGGHGQAGQFRDKCLEMKEKFKPSLADLRLVGRVGRIPGRILEQVALDDRRHVAAVIALADEALHHRVAGHHRAVRQALRARLPGPAGRAPVEPDRRRHGFGDQRFHRGNADGRQHGSDIGFDRPIWRRSKG
jgi:hypothetical protein